MNVFEKIRRQMAIGLALVFCLLAVGCGVETKISETAKAWPKVDRDVREDGEEPGRWPMWRGKNASGIASGGHPTTAISDTQGYRWKVAVPGRGRSSPVVWDNFVILTTELPGQDPPELAVLCYDRREGKLLWPRTVGPAQGETHPKNGWAAASVATDGESIFVSFGAAGLFAFDYSGKELWKAELGPLNHIWGIAASPILFENLVIQLCDYDGDSYIAAFDKATGEKVWQTSRTSKGSWSTPILVEAETKEGKRTELIVNGGSGEKSRRVTAYDPKTGKELWWASSTTDLVTPTILSGGGLVFSMSGRNGPVFAIRPGGEGDVTESHVQWERGKGGPYIPSGLLYRNRLYVLGDSGRLDCFNAGNGEPIWRKNLPGPCTSSLVAADGRIYAISEKGKVTIFAAADQYEPIASSELHEDCLATPAIVEEELLIRTEKELFSFSPLNEKEAEALRIDEKHETANDETEVKEVAIAKNEDGVSKGESWPRFRGDAAATGVALGRLPEKLEVLWKFTAKDGFLATAAIAEGMVYLGGEKGTFYALDLGTGKVRWTFKSEDGFVAPASVFERRVYVGNQEGFFYSLDAKEGKKAWEFKTEGPIDSGANWAEGRLLFGSQDSSLYCLDAGQGGLIWKVEIPGQVRSFPSMIGETIFLVGCDGKLHLLDLERGKSQGEVDLKSPTGSTAAILQGKAYVGTEGNQFMGIDLAEKKVLWSYESEKGGAAFRSSAAVANEIVVVGSRDKKLYAFEAKTGKILWTFRTGSRVDSSPVIVGERLFVGSGDGHLYGLDLKSGEKRFDYELGGDISASPAVAGGRLVIATEDGDVVCFGEKSP